MFNSILDSNITLQSFTICIISSLILGFIVAYLHMRTTRSNKNFVTTLFILPSLVASVILLVNGNLGTGVAVAGAFSLVRFRSLPGNSREILAVFFTMAIGLAIGTGYVGFASIFTLVICLVLLLSDIMKFGEPKASTKILKILVPEDLDYTDCFKSEFEKYTIVSELIKAKTINMGSIFELTYNVNLKKNINEKEFIDSLRIKNGNLKVALSSPMIEGEL